MLRKNIVLSVKWTITTTTHEHRGVCYQRQLDSLIISLFRATVGKFYHSTVSGGASTRQRTHRTLWKSCWVSYWICVRRTFYQRHFNLHICWCWYCPLVHKPLQGYHRRNANALWLITNCWYQNLPWTKSGQAYPDCTCIVWNSSCHDDVIKLKHIPRYWLFVGGIRLYRWIPLTKASDAELWYFLKLRLNKRLSKQFRRCWFETPLRSLWRHRYGTLRSQRSMHGGWWWPATFGEYLQNLWTCPDITD